MPHTKHLPSGSDRQSGSDMPIVKIPIKAIRLYSLVADMPRWADDSEEMAALSADIAARGVDQALFVTRSDHSPESKDHFYLVDGRHRFFGATLAGLKEVPCIIRDEAEASDIILHSLAQRRHYTKGALAYISWPAIADRVNGKQGNPNGASVTTFDVIADSMGFSRPLLFQAKQLHEIFEESPEYKARMEEPVLIGQHGIGAVIAGYGGMVSTRGNGKKDARYLAISEDGQLISGLMPKALVSLRNGFKAWPKLDFAARGKLAEAWAELMSTLPEDLR